MPKILIIRFSSIGDIVLTTPVIRCLSKQVKDAEIHFLTKEAFAGIVTNNPYVQKVYSIKKEISEVEKQLKAEKYDLVIDLHNNLRSHAIKRALKIKSTAFNKLNGLKWLYVNLKLNRLPQVHIVDRYLDTVRSLGVVNDMEGLDFFIPGKDEIGLDTLPQTHRQGYVAFVIGAKHFTKQLPEEKIISICKLLKQPVILLGGKEDEEKGNVIASSVGKNIFNACGKYNLLGSASLIKMANTVITHDTGLMHIAAAFKKDIFSVWGNTVPGFGMYPYLAGKRSKEIEVLGLPCRPCSKIGYSKCPLGHFKCMNEINEQKVAGEVNG